MKLAQLKQQILEKQNLSLKLQELEKDKSKYQRESSIFNLQYEEEYKTLEKLERKLLVINREEKIFIQEEKIRKIKSKVHHIQYEFNLVIQEIEKLSIQFNKLKNVEQEYIDELNQHISNIDSMHSLYEQKEHYNQIIQDNLICEKIIEESNKFIDCLKRIAYDLSKRDNIMADLRITLGNTSWILGNPYYDVKNIQKEIITFEDPLKHFIEYPELKVHIERYFEYSEKFFDCTITRLGLEFTKESYLGVSYHGKLIDFKRDICKVRNKINEYYKKNQVIEKELLEQFENYFLNN